MVICRIVLGSGDLSVEAALVTGERRRCRSQLVAIAMRECSWVLMVCLIIVPDRVVCHGAVTVRRDLRWMERWTSCPFE